MKKFVIWKNRLDNSKAGRTGRKFKIIDSKKHYFIIDEYNRPVGYVREDLITFNVDQRTMQILYGKSTG